jgi:predicted permease
MFREWRTQTWLRLKALLKRRQLDRDLNDEIAFHLAMREEKILAGKLESPLNSEDAHYSARRRFGNATSLKEVTREMWTFASLETIWQDVRYGARVLRKNPGFTAVTVLILALGIGANTAIFSLVNAVILRSLPVHNPQELVLLKWVVAKWPKAIKNLNGGTSVSDAGIESTSFTFPSYETFASQKEVFSSVFAFVSYEHGTVVADGSASVVKNWERVSEEYFSGLGVTPYLGRTLTSHDDPDHGDRVAVVSYSFWQQKLGGTPSAIGKTILLNTKPTTVVGVAPPEFFGVVPGYQADLWVPIGRARANDHGLWWLQIMARLKPGVSKERARAALNVLLVQETSAGLDSAPPREEIPQAEFDPAARGLNDLRKQFSKPLKVLMAIVGLVLLIACANVANLMLARSSARVREISVRSALGASRARLVRQLLVEGALIALLGSGAGLAFAVWGRSILIGMMTASDNSIQLQAGLDLRVLAFTFGVSALTAILFGLLPGIRASRVDLTSGLKDGSAATSPARAWRFGLRKTLVIAQTAISLVLLVAAGMFVRTLLNLEQQQLGFDPKHLLLFTINPASAGYKAARVDSLYDDLLQRIRATPGVRSASLSQINLISNSVNLYQVSQVEGIGTISPPENNVCFNYVGPDYLRTMGIRLLSGRDIEVSDNSQSPWVGLINQTMARNLFGNENPIGRWVPFKDTLDGPDKHVTIVGIVNDAKFAKIQDKPPATMYVAYQQHSSYRAGEMNFAVRTTGNVDALISDIRKTVANVDHNLPVYGVVTQEEQIENSLSQQEIFARLSGFFGLVALLLVCIGLYGVMAFSVVQRTREIGLRMALGAHPSNVLGMILRESMLVVVLGVGLGLIVALAGARVLTTFLFGLKPHDPATIGIAVLLMLSAAAVAALLPARRAMRVDPMTALRHE